ncbi:MAG: glycosyltransferase family 4 protein [bacterium]
MKKDIKILWIHPRLRDYRKPLFDLMDKEYNIKFVFGRKNPDIVDNYNSIYLSTIRTSLRKLIKLNELKIIAKEIKNTDVVISSFLTNKATVLAVVLSRLYGKKIIVWEERWYLGISKRVKRLFDNILSYFVSKGVNSFYVMGEPQYEALLKLRVKPNKIFTANEYSGFNYSIQKQKQSDIIKKEKKNILYFGRFVEIKGIEYLIDAFQIIEKEYIRTEFVLNIVGTGPLKEALNKRISDLQLNNVFIHNPVYDVEEKSYLFNNSYIAVIPSIITKNSSAEGGPIVTFEFLSAGLPLIGSNALGTRTLFNNYNIGELVNEKSANEIAEAIIKLDAKILNGEISKELVKKEFAKLPGYNNQFNVLKDAVDFAL